MKIYIIFTTQVTNMGGAQMYNANKVRFLKNKGWNVFIFFPQSNGEVLIPELKEYKNNIIPELGIQLRFLTCSMKKAIYHRLDSCCRDAQELVMESQVITSSFLVEEIAAHYSARHIINSFDERILLSYENQNRFFEYKLRRWEFQNASERRLKQTFGTDYKDEYKLFENNMVFKCSNVVSDDADIHYSFAKADYSILSIARLDKPYIMTMTEEIRKFSEIHSDKKLNVIYVGGSIQPGRVEEIRSVFKHLNNVNLYMLGYTFPVPRSIVEDADVAIAISNSVNVTADMDVPTIAVDNKDSMAIGVYGYDTENKIFRTSEPAIPISILLEAVLLEGKYPRRGVYTNTMSDVNEAFEKDLSFIEKSKGNTGYYDVESLITLKNRVISRLVWWKYQIIDPSRMDPRKKRKYNL